MNALSEKDLQAVRGGLDKEGYFVIPRRRFEGSARRVQHHNSRELSSSPEVSRRWHDQRTSQLLPRSGGAIHL